MRREIGDHSGAARQMNWKPSKSPLVFGVACFGVLLAGVWAVQTGLSSGAPDVDKTEQAKVVPPQIKKERERVLEKARRYRVSRIAQAQPAEDQLTNLTQPVSAEIPIVEPNREESVEEFLAAGEFVAAVETASGAEDPAERSALLKQVADAQMELGDFEAAETTIRRIPDRRVHAGMQGETAVRKSLAGGASLADFETLKNLIKESVDEAALWLEDDGEGGTMTEYDSGVRVDPNGLLYRLTKEEREGRLKALGLQTRTADLNEDMGQPSPLRLVSLTRLEREIARRIDQGEPVLETMKHLAGLTKIRYVFIYPEESEIVIGGPAEGWRYTGAGYPSGIESGRPTLQLDDFVTVLRTFAPGGNGAFQCLIVPRQEGFQRVSEYAEQSENAGPLPRGGTGRFAQKLGELLGLQDVIVNGVPADSRVARVIVEADYRMKLIGIDKLDAGPDIPSYFDLLGRHFSESPASMNALRWWLTMKYDAVLHSPDRDVFEITGSSVRCQSEDELVNADGRRIHTGQAGVVNRLFAQNFTRHYDQLAERDPVFADLENIFDLALVAALIRHERADRQVAWNHGAFAREGDYRRQIYAPAENVMSVINHRVYHGKDVVVQVAGGVRGDLLALLGEKDSFREVPRLESVSERSRGTKLPEGRWWWDAPR